MKENIRCPFCQRYMAIENPFYVCRNGHEDIMISINLVEREEEDDSRQHAVETKTDNTVFTKQK